MPGQASRGTVPVLPAQTLSVTVKPRVMLTFSSRVICRTKSCAFSYASAHMPAPFPGAFSFVKLEVSTLVKTLVDLVHTYGTGTLEMTARNPKW